MKEQAAVVVENVLTVVAGVEHRTQSAVNLENLRQPVKHIVGVPDGVVIGVKQIFPVLEFCLRQAVWTIISHRLRITLTVFKMRAVGVEYDKDFASALGQKIVYHCQQLAIVDICVLGLCCFHKNTSVSLPAKEVDERVVGKLVREKCCKETCLTESRQDALLFVQAAVVVGRSCFCVWCSIVLRHY